MKNTNNGGTTMVKLDTIQKQGKLNDVYALGLAGELPAYRYVIVREGAMPSDILSHISFQQGPRGVEGSKEGVLVSDLLEIVRHQLNHYQQGDFPTTWNERALGHVEGALAQLNKRVEDRIEREVLGKNKK